jgi:rhodanese-related sulfurtransferase
MKEKQRLIIDVREPVEYMFGHVKGAINIPPTKLMSGAQQLDNIPKDTELILYCLSGSRSAAAINILERLGYTNLINGINKDQVKAKYLS